MLRDTVAFSGPTDSSAPVVTISVGKTRDRRPTFTEVFPEKSTAEVNNSTASPSTTTESRSDEEFILIQTKQDGMEPSNRLDPIPNGRCSWDSFQPFLCLKYERLGPIQLQF